MLVDTPDPNKVPYKLQLNLFNQFRYLNQQLESPTFTDHLGNVRPVDARNDFNVNRNLFYFGGLRLRPQFHLQHHHLVVELGGNGDPRRIHRLPVR